MYKWKENIKTEFSGKDWHLTTLDLYNTSYFGPEGQWDNAEDKEMEDHMIAIRKYRKDYFTRDGFIVDSHSSSIELTSDNKNLLNRIYFTLKKKEMSFSEVLEFLQKNLKNNIDVDMYVKNI